METIGEKAEGKSLTRSVTKKSIQKRRITNCESCMNYEYDEEYEYYVCSKNLDEDEMARFYGGSVFTTVLITGWGMNTPLSGIRCSKDGTDRQGQKKSVKIIKQEKEKKYDTRRRSKADKALRIQQAVLQK